MGVKECSASSVGHRAAALAQQSPVGNLLGPLEELYMGSASPDGHPVGTGVPGLPC